MYVLTVVRMARAVTPVMVAQGGGAIVNISSMNATEPRPGYARMSVLRACSTGSRSCSPTSTRATTSA